MIILIVDDDHTATFLVKNALSKSSSERKGAVLLASNGWEALKIIQNIYPDGIMENQVYPELILLDLNLSIMNGFDFLEELQNLPQLNLSRTKIVWLTSCANPRDLERARQYPISCCITKPITPEKLELIINGK